MLEITRSATFTDHRPDEELTTIVARSVLEAALTEDDPGQLWFEVESGDETRRVAVDLSAADLEELLRLSGSDDVALSLDADEVRGLFDDPDVEGHGMKGAIAIAVTSAALLAPAGHAAVPQSIGTQSIGTQATTQRADVAATTQIGAAVSTQISNAAAKAQVASVQAKLAKSNAAKLRSFKLLRSGLVR